jgi:hypothetical protein
MRESIYFVFLLIQKNSSFKFKLIYYITYYYLNSLSITDCNVIKNVPKKTFFNSPLQKKNGSATATKRIRNKTLLKKKKQWKLIW